MAFVYRKDKQQINRENTPGPGQYEINKQNGFANTTSSFFDRAPRKLWETSTSPGPGEYCLDVKRSQIDGQSVLFGKTQKGFCVIDNFFTKAGGCSSSFKSKSQRMVQNQNRNPGPGQYEKSEQYTKAGLQNRNVYNQKPTKLTKYLYEQTRKQNKTPTNISSPEYKQTQHICHQQVVPTFDHNDKENKNQKYQIKNNYGSIFNSKVQRQINLSRPQTSTGVGPGSYNVIEAYSAFDRRSYNQRKNIQITSSTLKENQLFNQNQDIGPGYYKIEDSCFRRPQSSQSRGIACFGSRESRFNKQKFNCQIKNSTPGPQSYFRQSVKTKEDQSKKQQPKKIPFNSLTNKNTGFISTLCSELSPCTYNPKNDFNELLKKNYLKGTIGKFGSTAQRFKQNHNKKSQNNSQNDKKINIQSLKCGEVLQKQKKMKSSFSFQKIKKIKKFYELKQQKDIILDDRPLCYDSNSKTINSKFCKKQQKQAPFMTVSQRFTTTASNKNQQILDYIKSQQQKIILINKKKKTKAKQEKNKSSKSILNKYFRDMKNKQINKQKDLDINQQISIGPQTYFPTDFPKKKSYNVLFL